MVRMLLEAVRGGGTWFFSRYTYILLENSIVFIILREPTQLWWMTGATTLLISLRILGFFFMYLRGSFHTRIVRDVAFQNKSEYAICYSFVFFLFENRSVAPVISNQRKLFYVSQNSDTRMVFIHCGRLRPARYYLILYFSLLYITSHFYILSIFLL